MTVDIKLFAPVARATNAIYMYVIDPNDEKSPAKADKWTQIKGPSYFSHAELVGSVKVGDIILVNDNSTAFGILRVTAKNVAEKSITTAIVSLGS